MSKACDSQRVALLERRVDPALGGVGVRAHRVDLGDDPDRDALLGGGERRPLPGEAGSDHQYVVLAARARSYIEPKHGPRRLGGDGGRRAGGWSPPRRPRVERVAQRPADLVGGDHAAQAAVGVDRHEARRGGAGRRFRAATRAARRRAPAACRSSRPRTRPRRSRRRGSPRGRRRRRRARAGRGSAAPASTTGNQGQR